MYTHLYTNNKTIAYQRRKDLFYYTSDTECLVQQLKLYLNNIVSFCCLQHPPQRKIFLLCLPEGCCHHGSPVKEVTGLQGELQVSPQRGHLIAMVIALSAPKECAK